MADRVIALEAGRVASDTRQGPPVVLPRREAV
jgi:hypothetical protein